MAHEVFATSERCLSAVLVEARRCPPALIGQQYGQAAIEFCRESGAYLFQSGAVNVVADEPIYTPSLPQQTKMRRLLFATIEGVPLKDVILEDVRQIADWDVKTEDTPQGIFLPNATSVRLVWIPERSITDGLEYEAALVPTEAATGIDSAFLDEYVNDLAWGVLASLLVMADKPWTNHTRAGECAMLFRAAWGKAKLQKLKSGTQSFASMPLQSSTGR